jgi:dihydropteroate synthase
LPAALATREYFLRFPLRGEVRLVAGRPRLLGVVNVTPDSFSDGGLYATLDRAVEHALALAAGGADWLDLGAESTRPGGGVYGEGAREVSADEELDRLLPVLERLRPLTSLPISIDTRKAEVARAALAAGADLVNDVSALGDPEMAAIVAEAGCPVVLMHSRGELRSMQRDIRFDDVVRDVRDELAALRARAVAAGIAPGCILLDPGLGFGKTAEQNLRLLASTSELLALDSPLVIGASRKSFLGALTGAPPAERLPESLAAAGHAVLGGAAVLRVHDVAATRAFLSAWEAIDRERSRG